jgi:peroxiredoxin
LLTGPGLAAQSADVIGLPIGSTPPAVAVEDLKGNPVSLGQWIGRKPVLLEFWAAWCPQCAELLPLMEAAQRRFGSAIEFLVVAVAVNQTPRSVARHLERHPMPFTFLWDAKGAAVRAFQAPATSYVVVLDADGRVAYTGIGGTQDLGRALELVTR